MHSIYQQISAFISGASNNSFINSELQGNSADSTAFSSLLAQYTFDGGDAKFAASHGKTLPVTNLEASEITGSQLFPGTGPLTPSNPLFVSEPIDAIASQPLANIDSRLSNSSENYQRSRSEREIDALPQNSLVERGAYTDVESLHSNKPIDAKNGSEFLSDGKAISNELSLNTEVFRSSEFLSEEKAISNELSLDAEVFRSNVSTQGILLPDQVAGSPVSYDVRTLASTPSQNSVQNVDHDVDNVLDRVLRNNSISPSIPTPLDQSRFAASTINVNGNNSYANTQPGDPLLSAELSAKKVVHQAVVNHSAIQLPENVQTGEGNVTTSVKSVDADDQVETSARFNAIRADQVLSANGRNELTSVRSPHLINHELANQGGEQARPTLNQFAESKSAHIDGSNRIHNNNSELRAPSISDRIFPDDPIKNYDGYNRVQNTNYSDPRFVQVSERELAAVDSLSVKNSSSSLESISADKLAELSFVQKSSQVSAGYSDAGAIPLKASPADGLAGVQRSQNIDNYSPGLTRSAVIDNGGELSEQIIWAQRNNTNQIRISISPAHLGSIEINIDEVAEGINIQFLTQNAGAKDALEIFMPRLKEMLEQSGLNLQNANVSQQGDGKNSEFADQLNRDNEGKNPHQFDQPSTNEPGDSEPPVSDQYLFEAFA